MEKEQQEKLESKGPIGVILSTTIDDLGLLSFRLREMKRAINVSDATELKPMEVDIRLGMIQELVEDQIAATDNLRNHIENELEGELD